VAKQKNPHAVALGRAGGRKSAATRMVKILPERRREIARKAVLARWAREKAKKRIRESLVKLEPSLPAQNRGVLGGTFIILEPGRVLKPGR